MIKLSDLSMAVRGCCVVAVLVLGGNVKAAPSTAEARVYKHDSGATLPYRVVMPPNYNEQKKYPLVVCLHGKGGCGTDNKSRGTEAYTVLSDPLVQNKYPSFLLTPQCPTGGSWWKTAQGSTLTYNALTAEIVEALTKEFSIDSNRIYVTGQSLGGYGTWGAIIERPDMFAAAVPVCGGGYPHKAQSIAHIPLWVFHGAKDKIVLPEKSREMVEAVRKHGGTVKYTEYPEERHKSWIPAWKEKELIPWLFSQRNGNQ